MLYPTNNYIFHHEIILDPQETCVCTERGLYLKRSDFISNGSWASQARLHGDVDKRQLNIRLNRLGPHLFFDSNVSLVNLNMFCWQQNDPKSYTVWL